MLYIRALIFTAALALATSVQADSPDGGGCGNGFADAGESCDDGNLRDGDGCSQTCLVESGWECSQANPQQAYASTARDPSFELGGELSGTPNPYWEEAGQVVLPICSEAICGAGVALHGDYFVWFGGIPGATQLQSVRQIVRIREETEVMTFGLLTGICDSEEDHVRVLIDGNEVFNSGPCTAAAEYTSHAIDLSGFNDSAVHALRIEGRTFARNGDFSSFFVDSVLLRALITPPLNSSECQLLPAECYREDFEAGLAGWTTFNTGPLNLDWGTSDDGVCFSDNLGPPPADNVTGGSGIAACVDSDQAGAGVVESYLCSPAVDLDTTTAPQLTFLYNYQRFGPADGNDALEVLVGSAPPSAATIGSYNSQLFVNSNQGGLGTLPGASETLFLTPDAGPYFCFRYVGNFDWYAQLDEVRVLDESCEVP